MRWTQTKLYAKRDRHTFAWFPIRVGGETRWLEHITIEEEYQPNKGWTPLAFLPHIADTHRQLRQIFISSYANGASQIAISCLQGIMEDIPEYPTKDGRKFRAATAWLDFGARMIVPIDRRDGSRIFRAAHGEVLLVCVSSKGVKIDDHRKCEASFSGAIVHEVPGEEFATCQMFLTERTILSERLFTPTQNPRHYERSDLFDPPTPYDYWYQLSEADYYMARSRPAVYDIDNFFDPIGLV